MEDQKTNNTQEKSFGEMTPEEGYKTQTMLTLVRGLASMVGIFVLNLIF